MQPCRWYLLVGLGLGIATTGGIFFLAWRNIFDILVTEEKSLMPGSALYKEWRRPTVLPSWRIYAYNWTNADSYLEHPNTMQANFRELGPFTYDEHTEVVDVKFDSGNGTLFYRKRTIFRKTTSESSNGPLQHENITTVNFVALLASFMARNLDYSAQRELSFLLYSSGQNVTTTRAIGQLLFGAHREPLLEQVRNTVCPKNATGVPCQDERLAYFRTYNVTRRPSEKYSLNVGLTDRALYGTVQSWGNGTKRNEGSACENFAGHTGDFFPSRIDRTKPLTLILPELCQRWTLEYAREQLVDDIAGYRYVAKVDEAPSTRRSEQMDTANCTKWANSLRGYAMLISSECHGLPLYRTGSEVYATGTTPMEEAEWHGQQAQRSTDGYEQQIYFVLEPNTGTVLESFISMKYHTLLTPNAQIALFQDVPVLRVPLFRFDRSYRLSEKSSLKLKNMLHLLDVGHQAALGGCALGGIIVALTIAYACWNGRKLNKSHPRKLNAEYSIVGTQLANGGGVSY